MRSPTKTWNAWNPVIEKNNVPYTSVVGVNSLTFSRYSTLVRARNVPPMTNVRKSPSRSCHTRPFLIPISAQCMGALESSRIGVAIETRNSSGFLMPSGGHTGPCRKRRNQ